jgi:DNA-binding protein Fis
MTDDLLNEAIKLSTEKHEIENYLKELNSIDKNNVLRLADIPIPQNNEFRPWKYIPIPKSLQDSVVSSIQKYYEDKLTNLNDKFEKL